MNRKIKAGVIGLGMGKTHLEGYKTCKDAEIIAICDVNKERLEFIKKQYQVPWAFTNYKKMFELKELDAVSICTPNNA